MLRCMKWSEYVRSHAAGRNQEDLALLVGASQGAVSRWMTGKTQAPSAEKAIAFARAVGDSPVLALVASGHLRADDIEQAVRLAPDLPDLDAAALLIELGRRLGVRLAVPSERRRGA